MGYASPTQVSGGIRPQFQFGHPSDPRGLTVRKGVGFKVFLMISWSKVVQFRVEYNCNAVPPLLAGAVAKAIKKYLK